MSNVNLQRCETYEGRAVATAVRDALDGMPVARHRLKRGTAVLLKPNLINPRPPETAVCTHPAVVRAVAEICGDAGCRVLIADEPGYAMTGVARTLFELSGIAQACEGLDVEFALLKHGGYELVDVPAPMQIHETLIATTALQADIIINMPKCKTHQQTLLTGAIKNMFGVVAPKQRIQTHLLGSFDAFGQGLADTFSACVPHLNVMDAVMGMEGKGPSRGKPRKIGAIIASEDAVALDAVTERITGFAPGEVRTTTAAAEKGLGRCELDKIDVIGADPDDLAVTFQRPPGGIRRGFPRLLGRLLHGMVWVRPDFNLDLCVKCGACAGICPVDAITMNHDYPSVDREKCIECFCCQEVCPEGAIDTESSWLASKIIGDRSHAKRPEDTAPPD